MNDRNRDKVRTDAEKADRNEDPLSGEAGAHPIGTGLGAAAGGAAAGAAIGSVAGPVGTILGTVAGGIAGAYAGKAIAESIDPTIESTYWKSEYRNRPYYREGATFETYEPAYRAGWESYHPEADWTVVEPKVKKKWEEGNWESEGGAPRMSWEKARQAAQDAYYRVHAQRPPATGTDDTTEPPRRAK